MYLKRIMRPQRCHHALAPRKSADRRWLPSGLIFLLSIISALGAAAPLGHAQPYPSKPIRLVTPYAPGSSGDGNLRIVAPVISAALGQPLVIDARPGAAGLLAAELVVRAAPDGYTLLASNGAIHVIRPFLAKSMPFDPAKDLTPITQYTSVAACIVAGPSLPAQTLHELLDYARKNPGSVAFGTSGIGSESHLAAEAIMQLTGVKLLHVPYRSGYQAMTEVIAGQLPMSIGTIAAAQPLVASGKLRILAILREKRLARLPDIPAVAEVVPGFEPPPFWTGIFGPSGLSPALAKRISTEFANALKVPEVREKTIQSGNEPVGSTPEEFAASIKRETALIGRIVKDAGIKPE